MQVVPANILANFDVRLDRYSELDEALDLAIKHMLRQHPVRDASAIQPACFRRLLEYRDLVTKARKLIGSAVAGGPRAHDRDRLAVRRARPHYVMYKRLPQIAKKTLDRSNRDGLVVLPTIAGLLTRVIAHPARD